MLEPFGVKYLKKIRQEKRKKDNLSLILIWMTTMMSETAVKAKRYVFFAGNYLS